MASRALRALLLLLLVFQALACSGEPRVGSIGAVLARDNESGALYVRDLSSGLEAERSELLPGDEILMVEGRYVRELETKELRALLRGDVGASVRLTIVRGGEVRRIKVARVALREGGEVKPRVETLAE
ncbi:PDZ domain-containing protein [Polyangium aurulentum]|uniref:PDZ domain-containing protein n=1 Tax=Polyangium aurulentum TaxID=2567896 RepID=UPI0010ADE55F|nr:PDZ domain-containing protein [Polyangium aurulentum]UQA62364.1 PDZ domain-containing protein [Polyangium aurulentum]